MQLSRTLRFLDPHDSLKCLCHMSVFGGVNSVISEMLLDSQHTSDTALWYRDACWLLYVCVWNASQIVWRGVCLSAPFSRLLTKLMRALRGCEGKERSGELGKKHAQIYFCFICFMLYVLNKEKLLHCVSDYQEKLSKWLSIHDIKRYVNACLDRGTCRISSEGTHSGEGFVVAVVEKMYLLKVTIQLKFSFS